MDGEIIIMLFCFSTITSQAPERLCSEKFNKKMTAKTKSTLYTFQAWLWHVANQSHKNFQAPYAE